MKTQKTSKKELRKLTRGDLANINSAALIMGCCTQGCCNRPFPTF